MKKQGNRVKIEAPVEKNQEIMLTIKDWGSKGEGIGRYEGFTVFVEGALPGEVVWVRIVQVRKGFAFGKLMKVMEPSADRVKPACLLAGQCGGCQLCHVSYGGQLRFKRDKVRQALERIGHFSPEEVAAVLAENTLGMAEEGWMNYRNKAQFPIQIVDGQIQAGFYAPRSHRLLPVTDCKIQSKTANRLIQKIVTFMQENQISVYDEEKHEGLVRHVLIRVAYFTGQVSVCVVINGRKLPKIELWVQLMQDLKVDSFSININTEKSNVILGTETRLLYGTPYIEDQIGDLRFHISPTSFYQVNPVQTAVLYEKALEMADLSGDEIVWDAYCGIGTISLFLAQKAKKVYGVEVVPAAIEDARKNAQLNSMDNTEFFVGKAEEVIPSLYKEQGIRADVMVVDPPRAGCDEVLLRTLMEMAPKRIVYVSCDPATLARDFDILCHQGQYRLQKVQPTDMFPNSYHVETVALLQRKPDTYVRLSLDMEDYYRIMDAEGSVKIGRGDLNG